MRSRTIIGYEKYLKEIKKIQCKSEKLHFNTVILLQKDEDLPSFLVNAGLLVISAGWMIS